MATGALGLTIGVAVAYLTTACTAFASGPVGPCIAEETFATGFAVAALLGAAMWFALPCAGDPLRAVRAAGVAALFAGPGVLIMMLWAVLARGPAMQAIVLPAMAAIPASMLLSARPDARLALAGMKNQPLWIRAGAWPTLALFAGVGLGMGMTFGMWTEDLNSSVWAIFSSPFSASALLCIAGILILRGARPASSDKDGASIPRARRSLRLTPMQRYAFLAEVSVAASVAGSAAVVFTRPWTAPTYYDTAAALLMGGLLGTFAFALMAPALDARQGRGRLISLAPLLAGIAPLIVAAYAQGGSAFLLLGAAALLAFALCSAPQRYALAFDLCPSKNRLRASMDFQGAKLAVAAGCPLLVVWANAVLPNLGLLLLSALGLFAFAVFGATLGGLGRRTL